MYIIIVLSLVIVVLVLTLARSPEVTWIRFVPDLADIKKKLSVWIAAATALLSAAIPVAEQLQRALPTVEGLTVLHDLTQSPQYQTAVSCLAAFIVVARMISIKPPSP